MKYIALIIGIAFFTTDSYAQKGDFILTYPIAFPLGNLHDYSSNTSFRGISLEFNRLAKPGVTVGLETGWNVFYQHVSEREYKEGTATITGVQYRYTNAVPIIAGAKYYPESGSKVAKPYVGLGLGTTYINRSTDFGLYRITTEAWQFCLRPEAGALFKMQPGVYGLVGVKYYANFNTSDLDGQSFLSINVGMRFAGF